MTIQNKDRYFFQETLIQMKNLSDHKIQTDTTIKHSSNKTFPIKKIKSNNNKTFLFKTTKSINNKIIRLEIVQAEILNNIKDRIIFKDKMIIIHLHFNRYSKELNLKLNLNRKIVQNTFKQINKLKKLFQITLKLGNLFSIVLVQM